ncbi:MAG: hypothetical protein Q9167_006322 [Letrouitia subvulpina]
MRIPKLSLSFLLLVLLSLEVTSYDRKYDLYIPNTNLVLRFIERSTKTVPYGGFYKLISRVRDAINEGIKHHGGLNSTLSNDHIWVPVTEGITFTFENINAQPMLRTTYHDAQLMVDQLEKGVNRLDFHECTFKLLLFSEGRGTRKKAIAVGSIYLVQSSKRAELNKDAGEVE